MKHQQLNQLKFLKNIAALSVIAAMTHYLMAADSKVLAKPNIILIMADDLGYECLGANGGTSYNTPTLDKLAKTGMRFEHCYSQPLCTPSRVQLMTGIYNVRNYVNVRVLDRNQTTFAHLLKNAGYATCIAGKWQLGKQLDSPKHFGFDESCLWQHTRSRVDEQNHDTRYSNPKLEINGKSIDYTKGEYAPNIISDFICDFIERNCDKPFLAYYPMILTHWPFGPTPDSADWDSRDKGTKSYKSNAKYFGEMVSYLDKTVGKLIAKLDELGLRENTLVLFIGDNGTNKSVVSVLDGRKVVGGKGLMTDAGTHVPLIVNWKGFVPEGQVCRTLIDFSDFFPTLCETAGVTVPATLNIDGQSFLPQIKGRKGNYREWIYCWYSRRGNNNEAIVFVRNQRYKLYRNGKFYDIKYDVLERIPLQDDALDDKAKQIKAMLQETHNQYKNSRPWFMLFKSIMAGF